MTAAPRVVVMGVSGCGKTTVGRALAQALGVNFVEGDALHSHANIARMAAGIPLTDADRHGWLQAVAEQLSNPTPALKRVYRDLLRAGAPDLRIVFLHGDEATLAERLRARSGHYMPPSLLPSQLAALEPPQDDEGALRYDITLAPEAIVADAAGRLKAATLRP